MSEAQDTKVTHLPQVRNTGQAGKGQLIARFSTKYGVDESKLFGILKSTAFRQPAKRGEAPADVSNEQMAALLIVADQHGLNPFTREIYAFPDKSKGIVPIVGVDGWIRIMNEHPMFDGIEFRFSDDLIQVDKDHRASPSWCEAVIYRKDRSRPIIIREYLEECYRPAFEGKGNNGAYKITGPWQSHTRRFLRHKATIQGARMAFGFSGIYDEDEGLAIANARVVNMTEGMAKSIEAQAGPSLDELYDDILRNVRAKGEDPNAWAPIVKQAVQGTAKAMGTDENAMAKEARDNFDAFWSQIQDARPEPQGQDAGGESWEDFQEPTVEEAPGKPCDTRKRRANKFKDENHNDVCTYGVSYQQMVQIQELADRSDEDQEILEDYLADLGADEKDEPLTWLTAEEGAELIKRLHMAEGPWEKDKAEGPEPAGEAAATIVCPRNEKEIDPAVSCVGCPDRHDAQGNPCPAHDE